MKGKSPLFGSPDSTGKWKTNIPHSSKSVRGGLLAKNHSHPHSLPLTSIPNSTIEQTDDQGKVIRIRHYDENGNAYKDVDYTDRGRPDTHKVPHTHIIEIGEIIDRKKGAKSYAH